MKTQFTEILYKQVEYNLQVFSTCCINLKDHQTSTKTNRKDLSEFSHKSKRLAGDDCRALRRFFGNAYKLV